MAPQFEHVRFDVVLSALVFCPCPQLGCAEQDVERWLELVWYSLAPQFEHVRLDVVLSALIFLPGRCRMRLDVCKSEWGA